MSKKSAAANRTNVQIDLKLPEESRNLGIEYIARSLIEPDPEQPRQEPDADLRDAIALEGILQPITVRRHPTKTGMYMIVDGERRWKGADGVQNKIPCLIRGDQDDELHRLITQLMANTSKPLEPVEEAHAIHKALILSGKSTAELADMLGRPRSTLGDRLTLLDLGPWSELIEAGEVTVSHVIKEVAPLRGISDDHHREAIDRARKDYRWSKEGMSIDSFSALIDAAYRPLLYPLSKTTGKYGMGPERPTFDTKDHDKECDCGGIKFKFDYRGTRRCCGNPDWWRPRHRKGIAEKKKKAPASKRGSSGERQGRFYMPEGSGEATQKTYDMPSGLAQLTTHEGKWNAQALQCDPSSIEFKPESLKLVTSKHYGTKVGTTDQSALKAAREKFEEKFNNRRAVLATNLGSRLSAQLMGQHKLQGAGSKAVIQLLSKGSEGDKCEIIDVASAIGIAVPEKLASMNWNQWGDLKPGFSQKDFDSWLNSMVAAQIDELLTAVVAANSLSGTWPYDQATEERRKELEKIEARSVPWTKKPAKDSIAKKPAEKEDNSEHSEDTRDMFEDESADEAELAGVAEE